jgi:hypothetical protein
MQQMKPNNTRCVHAEAPSFARTEVSEMDRLTRLPRQPHRTLLALRLICLAISVIAAISVLVASLTDHRSFLVPIVLVGMVVGAVCLIPASRLVVHMVKCPKCRSRLIYHECPCTLESGKVDERILLECRGCGMTWDAGTVPSAGPDTGGA